MLLNGESRTVRLVCVLCFRVCRACAITIHWMRALSLSRAQSNRDIEESATRSHAYFIEDGDDVKIYCTLTWKPNVHTLRPITHAHARKHEQCHTHFHERTHSSSQSNGFIGHGQFFVWCFVAFFLFRIPQE